MADPVLETERLILRPLSAGDLPRFLALAGDWAVARMTSDIPHPLSERHGKAWLETSRDDVRFALDLDGVMIGSAGYFRRRSGEAELGFWLGRPFWGMGYATEAAIAVLRHGFGHGHDTFSSSHFTDNPASGAVLAKSGFMPVGQSRIWCSARGFEVEAVLLVLTRARATVHLGPLPEAMPEPNSGWSLLFGRWPGSQ